MKIGQIMYVDWSISPENYKICNKTKLLKFKNAKTRSYSNSYFVEEYKTQYRKSYYEDEINIRELAKKRLKVIKKYFGKKEGKLLEIGSAAGFFLDEATQLGFQTYGIEISENEAKFSKKYSDNVFIGSFLDYRETIPFDIVCAFFVIEHFENQEIIFSKLEKLVKKDGFLFLALPSINGPTFQTQYQNWIETHPSDHFYDYSPESLKKMLKMYSFDLVYKKPMSYHQNRDKGWKGKYLHYTLYRLLSDILCYSDTIQILAKKK